MYKNIFAIKTSKESNEYKIWVWDDSFEGGMKHIIFNNYAYRKNPSGVYESLYGDKLDKIINFNCYDDSLIESDVNITTRYLVDNYYQDDNPPDNHKIVYLDIETKTDNGFPNVDEANQIINAITIEYNGIYYSFILDEKGKYTDIDNDTKKVYFYSKESDLLKNYLKCWRSISPDIVTGWNLLGFDIPYLIHRIDRVFGNKASRFLSPIKFISKNRNNGEYSIAGISIIDYLPLYKKFTLKEEPNYRLDSIGKKIVNIGKIEYTGSLSELFDNDLDTFIEYNINDVRILVEMEKKLKYIELAINVCHACHVPYEDIFYSSKYIEGAILTYMKKKGLVAPNKPKLEANYNYNTVDKFEGAFVKEPIPGVYDWVYDLDATSLYPSIMRSLNISPETKVGKVSGWNPDLYLEGNLNNILINGKEVSLESFIKKIKDKEYSISSNGVLYKTNKQGIICEILEKWFNDRVEFRKLEKKYGKEGNQELYKFYNKRQLVQKVLLNSIYGCLGLSSWRFYDKDNAEAVTCSGQTIIKNSAKIVNEYYNKYLSTNGIDYNIYIDTDSLFFSAVPLIKKDNDDIDIGDDIKMTKLILEKVNVIQKYLNDNLDVFVKDAFNIKNHVLQFKQEIISKAAFFLKKKKYIQWVINEGGIEVNEIIPTGLDVKRSSFPPYFKRMMDEVLLKILNKENKNVIDKIIMEYKDNLSNASISDIAKNCSVKFIGIKNNKETKEQIEIDYNAKDRPIFTHLKGCPAQVIASLNYNDLLKLMGLKNIQPIQHGSKIKWVYLKNNPYNIESIAFKNDGNDPEQILDFIRKYVDVDKMFSSEAKNKIDDFYEALNYGKFDENLSFQEKFFDL